MPTLRPTLTAVALAATLALTACGSDDTTATASDPAASGSTSQGAGQRGGPGAAFDQDQLDQIRECLDAAGLDDPFPTDMPTDLPSDAPSDRPTDLPSDMPSDMPSDLPSDFDPDNLPEGAPSGGSGGGGGAFAALQDPEVQSALDACGIELPQRPTDAPS